MDASETRPEDKPARRIIAIAAMAENRVIGRDNRLPWHLPEDLHWFRSATLGRTLLMGRRTFASIGRPLPRRRTIVLTRTPQEKPIEGVEVARDWREVAEKVGPEGELWICGGANIYAATVPWWDELLLTRVKRVVEGDAFFPAFEQRLQLAEVVREMPEFRIERHTPV